MLPGWIQGLVDPGFGSTPTTIIPMCIIVVGVQPPSPEAKGILYVSGLKILM